MTKHQDVHYSIYISIRQGFIPVFEFCTFGLSINLFPVDKVETPRRQTPRHHAIAIPRQSSPDLDSTGGLTIENTHED